MMRRFGIIIAILLTQVSDLLTFFFSPCSRSYSVIVEGKTLELGLNDALIAIQGVEFCRLSFA